jgi:photosystem II stability/assembly factor-like uncharacterized protein
VQVTLDPVRYYFVTPSLGWAVENPTPSGRFAVFGTRDGARHRLRGPSEAWMGSGAVGAPHVYLSVDAGHTWQRNDLPAPAGRRQEVSVPTGVELLPQGGVHVWSYVPPPPGVVAYQDSLHWWAMRDTALFKSSDSGQTWTTVTKLLPDRQYVPYILDAKHAWAVTTVVAESGLALTDDGGLHWNQVTVPPPA